MNRLVIAAVAAIVLCVMSTPPAPAQVSDAIMKLDMSAVPNLDRTIVRQVQRGLAAKGFDPGTIDGVAGPQTRAAVREYQDRYGMSASGNIDYQLLFALGQVGVVGH